MLFYWVGGVCSDDVPFVFIHALLHRGQNTGPQGTSQVICGCHVGAEPLQRGGELFPLLH